jgi:hypothetical protein
LAARFDFVQQVRLVSGCAGVTTAFAQMHLQAAETLA